MQPTYVYTDTGEGQFEQVGTFKYVEAMVNTDSTIEEQIKERIAAGSRAVRVHRKLFTPRLISRNVQLQLYNTLIGPAATCACETWALKERLVNKLLMAFERKVMRKIFGPAGSDGGSWRIKTNQEINVVIKGQNIIWFIKMQRLSWLSMLKAWLMIIMLRRARHGNPCRKDQSEGLRHVGKATFRKIQKAWKYVTARMQHRMDTDGRKWLSRPEPCAGCSAL
jgi:hypothetical protein